MTERRILKVIILLTFLFSLLVIGFTIYTNRFMPIPKPIVTINQSQVSLSDDMKNSLETGVLRVNINTATKEDLMAIPGIGDVISQNIIDYRNIHGAFKEVDELLNIDKIGEKTLQNIKKYIVIE